MGNTKEYDMWEYVKNMKEYDMWEYVENMKKYVEIRGKYEEKCGSGN